MQIIGGGGPSLSWHFDDPVPIQANGLEVHISKKHSCCVLSKKIVFPMLFDLTFMVDKDGIKEDPIARQARNDVPAWNSNNGSEHAANPVTSTSTSSSAGTTSTRSQNIPLPSTHVQRTQSEVQFAIDQEAAEERDVHMFYRLVNGIRERQVSPHPHTSSEEQQSAQSAERSIASIVHTRLAPVRSGNTLDASRHHYVSGESNTDGWSITGYEVQGQESTGTAAPTAPVPQVDDPEETEDDEGVFEMEL
jgi:hypothetical protein